MFQEDWDKVGAFAEKHQMDGIELGLTPDYDLEKIPAGLVQGVHLSFYPMWLDFWQGNMEALEEILGGSKEIIEYYGSLDRQVMIDSYKSQYERAKALGAKYMVFHVSHVTIKDSFTWKFDYTDKDVMDATLELINEVFPADEDGPTLLFENLWWPGLTYLDPELTKYFLENVNYANKGYLLDISHLILTNPEIRDENDCYTYVKKIIEDLGEVAQSIKGVHLNKTLPRNYRKQDHTFLVERYESATTKIHRNKILKQHIQKLDPHQPFDHPVAKDIIELINPEFCVYETNPEDVYELAFFVKKQNINLGIKY